MSDSARPDPAAVAMLRGSGLPAALALLEQVASGHAAFDDDRRAWALAEGVDLSGWTLTEVQLAEGGDAGLAQRVLDLARLREAEGAIRRLSPWAAAPTAVPVGKRDVSAAAVDTPDPLHLRRVASGQAAFMPEQREMAIVDAMIRSDGVLASTELVRLSDAALAMQLLDLPEVDPLTGAIRPSVAEAIAA